MSEEIISLLKSHFSESILSIVSEENRIVFTAQKGDIYQIIAKLKQEGFNHLSDVTGVDYIDEGEFELIYHLWSHQKKLRPIMKVRIPRESSTVKSISDLWTGAQMHEREIHELFGIIFDGNPNLSELFLEDWDEIPPFRKDFDTRKYVKEKYYQDEEEYPVEKG
jgi:NADH-quinone oxidoreductase subunit C